MLENQCHRTLLLPIKFCPIDFGLDPMHPWIKYKFYEKQVNKEIKDWLGGVGWHVAYGRFFHTPPFEKYALHVDIENANDELAWLNFVFGGKDSFMTWYKLLPNKTQTTYMTKENKLFTGYLREDCEEIYQTDTLTADAGFAHLINGGIIHSMTNGSEPRQCFSMALYKKHQRLTWTELCNTLDSYVVKGFA
jgi:hypothetical protein